MVNDKIIIKGAREHNLKGIDLDIPKNKLVVISGVSGSGKSTLAFDTLYAEGQRRYVESLSAYARQFLELMSKPDVDSIQFLSPAISIEQKSVSRNPRSNVATVTEIYDYIRLLYARVGDVHCYSCGKRIHSYSPQEIVDYILTRSAGAKLEIMSPVVRGRKGEQRKLFADLFKQGFVRVYVDSKLYRLDEEIKIAKTVKHTISVVVDRLKVDADNKRRLTDSVEVALELSSGLVELKFDEEVVLMSEHLSCLDCGVAITDMEPRNFSFNNPYGSCKACDGLGESNELDVALIVPDGSLSIQEGAILPWKKMESYHFYNTLNAVSSTYGIDMDKPWNLLSDKHKDIMINGVDEKIVIHMYSDTEKITIEKPFKGVMGHLQSMLRSGVAKDKEKTEKYMLARPCPACKGKRLSPESLSVYVGGKNVADIMEMSTTEALTFYQNLTLDGFRQLVADKIVQEIIQRLTFLNDVGLHYINLGRRSGTLSGGEAQRIRLASQIGSGLTGVLYVLDEPSIGLHQRDNDKLLATLKGLRDLGNSVLVVEHDEDTLKQCDYVVDVGPYAGVHGGEVIFAGTPEELLLSEKSLTGAYLSGRLKIEVPTTRRSTTKGAIVVRNASENNLQGVDVSFPLGVFTTVTGVSGSGKSSLVMDVLYGNIAKTLYGGAFIPGKCDSVEGINLVDKIIHIDQNPIGRTPHSNPATYTGVLTDIREVFATLPEAKKRGYTSGRFSFNTKHGRCKECAGNGSIKIEMHFMPDMYVKCDTCKGSRYNRDTLDIKFNHKSIADVLDMTINQACDFFDNISRIKGKLVVLQEVGLGYLKLGQSSTTLSGGEAQRLKLSRELNKRSTDNTLYIFDEPTTGLHFHDIAKLIHIFNALVDEGNTVVVIEHNLDIIKSSDHIIDMGPDGGTGGGMVIFEGTPEEISKAKHSHTGRYMKTKLAQHK